MQLGFSKRYLGDEDAKKLKAETNAIDREVIASVVRFNSPLKNKRKKTNTKISAGSDHSKL